jgi:putative PIG3 family NAD(P)H quinone oxidoreductase
MPVFFYAGKKEHCSMEDKMKAITIDRQNGKGQLVLQEIPSPQCPYGHVCIDIQAAAVNRADILQVMGLYPGDYKINGLEIPGLECAGIIEAVGDGVSPWKTGDRVFALLPGGGYAQKVVVPAAMLMPVPENLDFLEAAAIPEAFFTAYDAMMQADTTFGDSVLVHAAASGVGTAAIQMAKAWGLKVFGTVSSKKMERLKNLALDRPIAHDQENFSDVLSKEWPQGVNVVLDLVGGDYLRSNLEVLATQGRIVQIGLLRGSKVEVPLQLLMLKRAKLMGTMMRLRSAAEKVILTNRFVQKVLPLFEAGKIKPIIDRVFTLDDVGNAHAYVRDGHNVGKVVLKIDG